MSNIYSARARTIIRKLEKVDSLLLSSLRGQNETKKTKPILGIESWHTFLPDIEAGYAPWLRTDGSLTLRIQQRCDNFRVCNVHNHLATAVYDETALLGLPAQQKIYTREVFLHADGKPVVYAHSVVAAQHLCGAWHALRNLGNRPLGALLFAHPLVQRSALHFRALKPNHPLYQRAAVTLATPPQKLWARRSLFILRNAPLLVTEIFLPDILALKK
ncbi:chorismate--pyruvate lyase family protein [Candidatus Nitrotoga sp. M5]|uniref:chorismate--pyruvate lyase family protein n=1 Tax=Candidatus Nitrotoga sp. M5 TaxID=2890409 RepID=UPI001EF533C6|nr:chorismate lyase [Candidatus Nitrotoga sp. M5]CAH1387868.1 Chorismate--pyruvate lyase [Candidatus Nitrotoga sp. M5]